MKKYYGYIRVSTARQGERSVSLPEQKEAIERHAVRNNLEIIEWFEERQTAAKAGRPVWNQMLTQLRKGKASGVIIHKIDRSARNLKDWANLGELIDEGIEVHFANEALDLSSRGGRLTADIQAVVASDYIRNLREEAKKGIYGRLKQGYYPLRAPIGYLNHGAGKPKTVDPERGPLVRKAFELYAAGRFTITPLVEEMFRQGLRNLHGGKVTRNGLCTILRNPFYVGLMHIKRTGQIFEGLHEALISKELFEQTQSMLEGRFNARPMTHDLLFRKFIECKGCGYSLIGEIQKGHVYYRCHTPTCPMTAVREESVANFLEEKLQKLSFSEKEKRYITRAIAELNAKWIEEKERHLAAAKMTLERVTERLHRLTDAFLDQAIDRDLYEERKTAILLDKRSVAEQIKHLSEDADSVLQRLEKFLELAGTAYSLYKLATPAKKREMLKMVTSNLSADRNSFDFAYSIPFDLVANRPEITDGGPCRDVPRTLDKFLSSLAAQITRLSSVVMSLEDRQLV